MRCFFNRSSITPWLIVLALSAQFTSMASRAIVIRHDVDDIEYREMAEKYVDAVVYLGGCAGTLIAPSWIVTAAHCLQGVGDIYLEAEHLDQRYRIERYFLHPEFQDGIANDIALVQLRDPITAGRVATLYDSSDEIGEQVVFVGRGTFGTGEAGLIRSDRVSRAATNVVDDADEHWIIFTFDEPGRATTHEGISGPGDSGGPAFIERDSTLYLAGVSSSQNTDPTGGIRAVYGVLEYYTRVSAVSDWVESVLRATPPVEVVAHPLIDAVQAGDTEAVRRALREDPAVLRDTDILGEAFYHALVADASDAAEYLIQNGAAYTAIRYSGLSIHGLAFSRRKTDYFDMLLRQDVGQNDPAYQAIPVLWMSLSRFRTDPGLIEIAADLLDKGANPNAQTQSGEHALHEAVFAGNLPIIRLLLERGADPNLPNNSGVTALMDAAASGQTDIVRYFLEAGADASISDRENRTALDFALARDRPDVARLLREWAEAR